MAKMACTSDNHGKAMFVGGRNDFLVPHRATGLNHCLGAGFGQDIDAVAEREECIGSNHAAGKRQIGIGRLDGSDSGRIDARHLTGADAERHAVAAEHDRVRFDELGDAVGEYQIGDLARRWLNFGHDFEVFRLDVK